MYKFSFLKSFVVFTTIAFGLWSCEYDDSGVWDSIGNLSDRVTTLEEQVSNTNNDLKALRTIVNAMQNQVTITSVEKTENGYVIKFSDGQTATISNGVNGADAPEISVVAGEDGRYYWTLDGDVIMVDGQPVCANGVVGSDGNDAIAPLVRINPESKMWEISIDNGETWTDTGVKAECTTVEGDNKLFESVDCSNDDYVVFVLSNGTEFKVARFSADTPMFSITGCEGVQQFLFGESVTYKVEKANVADYSISKPDGWSVKITDENILITAPVAENKFAESEGTISFNVVSAAGRALIVKMQVQVASYKLKILTFEDSDVRFTPYQLDNTITITDWSSLIDSKQYGGLLLYGESGYGGESPYYWYDENNTFLRGEILESWGYYAYWNGGHAISSYCDMDLSHGDFNHQLSVYATSGHNGSKNFAVHFGYRDNSDYKRDAALPALLLGDNVERIVDHMWIMNTTYAMNCYLSGNGLTAAIGKDDWVKLVATGFNLSGDKTGEVEIFTCNGPDNIVRDWTKWDLSGLGKVARIEFNVIGSSDNGAGFSQPAYFAYDDVAVRFE